MAIEAPNNAAGLAEHKLPAFLFQEQANVLGGSLGASVGKYHEWLGTFKDGKQLFSAGLGNADGIPGHTGSYLPDLPVLSDGYIRDHSSRNDAPGVMAIQLHNVDIQAMDSYLSQKGFDVGAWIPIYQDCNTFTDAVVRFSTPQVHDNQPNQVRWFDGTWRPAQAVAK